LPDLSDREIEALAVVPARRIGVAQLVVQLRKREVRRIRGVDGEARFEIILRLAP